MAQVTQLTVLGVPGRFKAISPKLGVFCFSHAVGIDSKFIFAPVTVVNSFDWKLTVLSKFTFDTKNTTCYSQ